MIIDRLVVGANGCGGYPKRVTHIALNHLTKHGRVREKYISGKNHYYSLDLD